MTLSNDTLINLESGSAIFHLIRCITSFGMLLGPVALLEFRLLILSITSVASVGVIKNDIHSYYLGILRDHSQYDKYLIEVYLPQ